MPAINESPAQGGRGGPDPLSHLGPDQLDELTRLAHRDSLVVALDERLSAQAGSPSHLAVVVCKVESLGPTGRPGSPGADEVVAAAARRLRRTVRVQDFTARLAPNTFAVLAGGLPRAAIAGSLALRLKDALSGPFALASQTVDIAARVGYAVASSGDETAEALLEQAEEAAR